MKKDYEIILKKTTILLIEDNSKLRAKFKTLLDMYVIKVYEASNGIEAIEIYDKYKPTIILTDYKIPTIDGLEFVRYIRKVDKYIPIVVISAYSEQESLIKFTSLKLVAYLSKPVDITRLDTVLELCAKELIEHGLIEKKICKNTYYSYSQKCILKNGKRVSLSLNEIEFLELLLQHKKQFVSLDSIERNIGKKDIFTDAAINNLVSRLRKKIGCDVIKNIPKTGYIFVYEENEE